MNSLNSISPNKTDYAGIYIHLPFCVHKCPYCDFYSATDLSLKQPFIRALMKEMAMSCDIPFPFDTIYIGGGTPSVFSARHIGQLIETAYSLFKILPDAEITIEVNPGTVDLDRLKEYKHTGVNRINIGVQSFQDKNLNFLGRIHSARDAIFAVEWARNAGFDNIGLDLIYGIPNQTKKSWLMDLKKTVELAPEHLSCYTLTYESGTAMNNDRQKGLFCPLPEHLVADLFELTIESLIDYGYMQYEISNFARSDSSKPGLSKPELNKSRHNRKYWSFAPYIGFGPSSHSFIEPYRYWNCSDVQKYIRDIDAGRLPIEKKELLNREQQIIEAIYLGLRQTDGIQIDIFDEKFGVNFKKIFKKIIMDLEKNGLLRLDQNLCALSRKGMLFHDAIVEMLICRKI